MVETSLDNSFDVGDLDDLYTKPQRNCNAIRRKFASFLATKEMSQTAFLQEIGCNDNSYGRYMMKLQGHGLV
jgi:hypothetical protein